jgi:hypothetical protein
MTGGKTLNSISQHDRERHHRGGDVFDRRRVVDKAIDQRCRGRHAEALLSAIAATELESDNRDAWWRV